MVGLHGCLLIALVKIMKNKPPFHFSSVSMSGSVCSLDFQDGITLAPVFRLDSVVLLLQALCMVFNEMLGM